MAKLEDELDAVVQGVADRIRKGRALSVAIRGVNRSRSVAIPLPPPVADLDEDEDEDEIEDLTTP